MKPALLASLVLFLLLVDVQGIRLKALAQQRVLKEKDRLIEAEVSAGGSNGAEDVVLCKNGQCSGRSRKLITVTPFTTTTQKIVKNEGTKISPTAKRPTEEAPIKNEENFSVKSLPHSEQRETTTGQYPDIIDIAGMDYSPARRKPPIHN
ncbi:hypothetical protein IFM89_019207 [Coptis chinensis]|uniref:Uncharacterized protein n=1 Tax=Coptis chinensis TaxID=261450 RepID=A0A835M5F1_9MAGN|nr:hypothetical protein IFM89_019207 [Coptis chinensis]